MLSHDGQLFPAPQHLVEFDGQTLGGSIARWRRRILPHFEEPQRRIRRATGEMGKLVLSGS